VGRFKVLGRLGSGGMGEVFLAEQPRIGKRVAIKVLRTEYVRDRAALTRFFREARLANQIRHEHLLDVLDFGELDDGRPFLIMELLEGESLSDRLRRGALDEGVAREIGAQIARTLAVVHEHGVVHRDLKPDNVFLLERPGRPLFVKLLDFGIARLLDEGPLLSQSGGAGPKLTDAGGLIGTPLYMSPEQVRGEPAGPSADIYALGALLFELVAGRPPSLAATSSGCSASTSARRRRGCAACGRRSRRATTSSWPAAWPRRSRSGRRRCARWPMRSSTPPGRHRHRHRRRRRPRRRPPGPGAAPVPSSPRRRSSARSA
jgi:serine/threonine protein kinase